MSTAHKSLFIIFLTLFPMITFGILVTKIWLNGGVASIGRNWMIAFVLIAIAGPAMYAAMISVAIFSKERRDIFDLLAIFTAINAPSSVFSFVIVLFRYPAPAQYYHNITQKHPYIFRFIIAPITLITIMFFASYLSSLMQ